ncbi:MAG: RHS repeat-associated core domain-containing protein [Lachnospiraceae bacterium]|nr:RHS repeat-associated core domain-containing protein [Lachnospiraceae bacterium]MBR5992307.1 RHS repeat-associated core domain-containing protein [Lachnospiraceae bacterium]
MPKEANIEESVSEEDIVTEIEAESDILLTDISDDDFMSEQQLLDSLILQSIGEKAEIQEATTASEEDLWKLEMLEQLIASQQEVSVSNEYCYDREKKNLLVRFSSDGTIEKYVYGNGLIASYETYTTEESTSTNYQTYIFDIRGSVTEVADISGSVTAEYRYSTYGDRSIISGTEFDELGYCARDGVLTEASGLLYMRARYYYPTLMRFINEDIVTGDISNSASLNRYTYVEGNPVTLIDPFGLCAEKNNAFSYLGDEGNKSRLKQLMLKTNWDSEYVTDKMVAELYSALNKYGITSKAQICMFLAECKLESQYGSKTVQTGSKGKYSGGGYIQMTGEAEYYAYATFLMLENIPELNDICKYIAPFGPGAERIPSNYYETVNVALNDLGISEEQLTQYTQVYDEGRQYVADNYAWDSAGYYWTYSKKIRADVEQGCSIDDVSLKIKYNCKENSLKTRAMYYYTTSDYFDLYFYNNN